jgi:hypothetical protein
MAEVHFVDGAVYGPEYFGVEENGIWVPITPPLTTEQYGTNGFHLDFADSSDIGKDVSGKGNNYTNHNSILLASDIVPDSPTNNFCILNYVDYEDQGGDITEGGLQIDDVNSGANSYTRGTLGVVSGKWYYEVYFINATNGGHIGWAPSEFSFTSGNPFSAVGQTPSCIHLSHTTTSIRRTDDVAPYSNSLVPGTYSQGAGVVLGVAYDADAGEIKYFLDGVAMDSGNVIVSVGNPGLGWMPFVGVIGGGSTQDYAVNFGQDSTFAGTLSAGTNTDTSGLGTFQYTVPAGYKALCTANLPEPSPAFTFRGGNRKPSDFFTPLLYTGSSTVPHSVTGVGFTPDLVWVKCRSANEGHYWHDTVRGDDGTYMYRIRSDGTNIQDTDTDMESIDSDGFTFSRAANGPNINTRTYVAWCWKAGGAPTATNSAGAGAVPTAGSVKIDGANSTETLAGTIVATRLSANRTSGFSIVTWEGTNAAGTVAHGLSQAPDVVLVKDMDGAQNWVMWTHKFSDGDQYQELNSALANQSSSVFWNSSTPDATIFPVGTSNSITGRSFVGYCWHEVPGLSKFGVYEGNQSSDGVFEYLGFTPAFIMFKNIDTSEIWVIYDNKRETYNQRQNPLYAHLNNIESAASSRAVDFVSNGFKVRGNDPSVSGTSTTNTIIYMAFAEDTYNFANAR